MVAKPLFIAFEKLWLSKTTVTGKWETSLSFSRKGEMKTQGTAGQ